MSAADVTVRAPNSVVLFGDAVAEPPETMDGQVVGATASCIAIGTRSEADGETWIRVLDKVDRASRTGTLAFDGVLEAPNRRLTLASVLGEVYADVPVAFDQARVQVWLNDAREPDAIDLVIEPAGA